MLSAGGGAGPGGGSSSARRQPLGTQLEHTEAFPRVLRGAASRWGPPGDGALGAAPPGCGGWGGPEGPRRGAGPGRAGRLSRRGVAARRLQSGRRGRRGRFSRLASSPIASRRVPKPEPCCTGDTTSTTVRASGPGTEAAVGAVRSCPGKGRPGEARSCESGSAPVPAARSERVPVRGSLCCIAVRAVPALSLAPAVSRSAARCRDRGLSFHAHGEMLWGLGCFVLPFISAILESPRCSQRKAQCRCSALIRNSCRRCSCAVCSSACRWEWECSWTRLETHK